MTDVQRTVMVDVYCWTTPISGRPGQYQHNVAVRGEVIEVSAAEAERGEGLAALADPDDLAEALALIEAEALDAIVVDQDGVEHTGVLPLSTAVPPEGAGAGGPGTPGAPVRPREVANKAAWLDYRVALGHVTPEQRAAIEAEQLVLTSAQLKDDAFMDDWATSPASTPAQP